MDSTNKGDLIRRTISKLENIMDDDFHGFRIEIWSIISETIDESQSEFYCQMHIEGDITCQNQCNHCSECYKPIEQ